MTIRRYVASKLGSPTRMMLLCALYVIAGLAYVRATPILEKSDEQGHYGYLLYLAEHNALPPLAVTDEASFEFKQPPLYYAIVWLLSPSGSTPAPIPLDHNPYVDFAVPGNRGDNRVAYLHPPFHTELGTLGRLVSLMFGGGTMIVSYFLAREVFPKHSYAPYAVAAIVGFQPRFLYMATAVNNDASAAFFGAAISLGLVLRLRRELSSGPYVAIMGIILGMAILAKSSNLLFFPLILFTLLMAQNRRLSCRLADGAGIVAIALLVGGWWYLRNALAYGDALTLGTHLAGTESVVRPLSGRLWRDLLSIETTFWANLARTTVEKLPVDRLLIWWGRLSTVAVILGLWRSRHRTGNPQALSTIVSLLSIPLTFLVVVVGYWTRSQAFTFGRLLLISR